MSNRGLHCLLFWLRWAPVRAQFPTHGGFYCSLSVPLPSSCLVSTAATKKKHVSQFPQRQEDGTPLHYYYFASNVILLFMSTFVHKSSFVTDTHIRAHQQVSAEKENLVCGETIDCTAFTSNTRRGRGARPHGCSYKCMLQCVISTYDLYVYFQRVDFVSFKKRKAK